MKRAFALLAAIVGTGLLATPSVAQPTGADVIGIWMNPQSSVAVRTGNCQGQLCGWVVWANAVAQQDARDSGVAGLVGTALLQDYHPEGDGRWSGVVYVPDIGHRFGSTIQLVSADQLRIRGCLIGGIICKTQIWHRIFTLPEG